MASSSSRLKVCPRRKGCPSIAATGVLAASLFANGCLSALLGQTPQTSSADASHKGANAKVWIAYQRGWHENGDKRWHWNNTELRREGGPSFLVCAYSSQLVEAQDRPGCVFVFDTDDAYWLLSNVQSWAQWHDINTQGRFRGMRTPDFRISFAQNVKPNEGDGFTLKEQVTFVNYQTEDTPEKEFAIENGRVFHVRWNEAKTGLECCQLPINAPEESLIRAVHGLVRSDDDKYSAFHKWWIDSRPVDSPSR